MKNKFIHEYGRVLSMSDWVLKKFYEGEVTELKARLSELAKASPFDW